MRIFRSIGLGIFLLVLATAMPRVFRSLEETIIALFNTAQMVLKETENLVASPASLNVPSVPF
ncbi:MAG: hypothetical protein KBD16_04560 [Candidatus Pacebacteria bacterium]|nr:hypothetical protein [Candidatus Paceibacterota bacterium]